MYKEIHTFMRKPSAAAPRNQVLRANFHQPLPGHSPSPIPSFSPSRAPQRYHTMVTDPETLVFENNSPPSFTEPHCPYVLFATPMPGNSVDKNLTHGDHHFRATTRSYSIPRTISIFVIIASHDPPSISLPPTNPALSRSRTVHDYGPCSPTKAHTLTLPLSLPELDRRTHPAGVCSGL